MMRTTAGLLYIASRSPSATWAFVTKLRFAGRIRRALLSKNIASTIARFLRMTNCSFESSEMSCRIWLTQVLSGKENLAERQHFKHMTEGLTALFRCLLLVQIVGKVNRIT